MPTRRRFITLGSALPIVVFADATFADLPEPNGWSSMNGAWDFHLDPENAGETHGWNRAGGAGDGWRVGTVPHTWQVEPQNTEHMGIA